ncbi:secretin N-terminal domain-containing protein [Planctomycetota bacterium]
MKNRCKSTPVVWVRTFIIGLITVVLSGSVNAPAQEKLPQSLARYRVFSLKNISAQKGKEFLEKLEIGTVSKLPNSNTLLVTALSDDLIKASTILELMDSEREYVIRKICSASEAENLSFNEQLAAELDLDISIGTFASPPSDLVTEKAIIDIHRDELLAVAPAELIENIISVALQIPASQKAGESATQDLEQLAESDQPAQPIKTSEPEEPSQLPAQELAVPEVSALIESFELKQPGVNDTKPDELFSRLLETLGEAEERAEEKTPKEYPANQMNELHVEAVGKAADANVSAEETKPAKDSEALMKLFSSLVKRSETEKAPEESELSEAAKDRQAPLTEAEPHTPEPSSTDSGTVEIDLPSKLNIVDLLGLVGEYLELDFMFDPQKVKGEVMLKFRGPIRIKDLYPLLESVLKFHSFVMTRRGSLVVVVPENEAVEIDPELYYGPGDVNIGDIIITRIFNLQHIDTGSAKNLLEKMKLGAHVEEIKATGTLIVTGFAYRMSRIDELLKMIDKPGKPRKFRFRRLQYTLAPNLASQVKNLAEELGTVSITIAATAAKEPSQIERREGESTTAFRQRQAAARTATRQPTPSRPSEPKAEKTGVYLDADERTNRILMIGLEEDLNLVEELVDALDVQKQDLRTMRLYEIQNVGAEDVEQKLNQLGIISKTTTSTRTAPARITRPTTTRPTTTTRPSAATATTPAVTAATVEEALAGQPQVVVIEATNSLLVNATAEQHAQIALIIGYVDARPEQASIPYVVYPLENQDPTDLAGVLNQLITQTTQAQDNEGKIVTTVTSRQEDENPIIIPDPKTYSLIVYASKKNQQWLSALIKKLDEYRAQVLLDITLVQITKTDAFNFDLELLSSIPDVSFVSGAVSGFDTGTSYYTNLLAAKDRNEFIELKSSEGSFTGFYGDEKISALLTAVQTKSYGRVMARPKLLVNDNEMGSIKTTDTTYVEKIEQHWTTGDNPVQSETKTYPDYSAGITLNITPHISTGNMLTLDITLNRSGFTSALGGAKPPDKADADVSTKITVPDGHTIILGGMEKIEHAKGGKKIPILGDIPIIGGAFREVAREESHDKLYIFVKAHILRPGGDLALADLKKVSEENRVTFEKLEREMQEYEDWPGLKPDPMDPVSVLEAD